MRHCGMPNSLNLERGAKWKTALATLATTAAFDEKSKGLNEFRKSSKSGSITSS